MFNVQFEKPATPFCGPEASVHSRGLPEILSRSWTTVAGNPMHDDGNETLTMMDTPFPIDERRAT